jgi:hypothetical protein
MTLLQTIIAFATLQPGPNQCGGFFPLPDSNSAPVRAFLRESGNQTGREILQQYARWETDCDEAAARNAIFETRRLLQRANAGMGVKAVLGMMLLGGPEVEIPRNRGLSVRPVFQLSNAELDGNRLSKDVSLKTDWPENAVRIAAAGLASRSTKTLESARVALQATLRNGDNPLCALLLLEVSNALRDYEKTLQRAKSFPRIDDSFSHAIAVAELMTGDSTRGAQTYIAGMATASPIVQQLYYDDIILLLTSDEAMKAAALPVAQRAIWVGRLWQQKAAVAGISLAERLQEHFRRMGIAFQQYLRLAQRLAPTEHAIFLDSNTRFPLDDRGLIFVRHGDPDGIVSNRARGSTRIAWGYRGLMNGIAFEFDRERSGDYHMVEPLNCDTVPGRVDFGSARLIVNAESKYLSYGTALLEYDPQLASVPLKCWSIISGRHDDERNGWVQNRFQQRIVTTKSATVALETESAARKYRTPLPFVTASYAFRQGDSTAIYAVVTTMAAAIQPDTHDKSRRLDLSLSIDDPLSMSFLRSDTTLTIRDSAVPLSPDSRLSALISIVAAPANSSNVHIQLRNAADKEVGQMVLTKRAIPNYAVGTPAISDIVVGSITGGWWKRGGISIGPIPGHVVRENERFSIYYEVYNVTEGDSASVELQIVPVREGGIIGSIRSLIQRKEAKQVTFTEVMHPESGQTVRILRELMGDLKAGRYVLSITLRIHGTSTSASTDLVVIEAK